ncbi:MAG: hypothetical protein D9V47_11755 [Clostridia bacterium]|nr:MAG: hypothetical protein D9V47_11755 [Clostridia bacterium]
MRGLKELEFDPQQLVLSRREVYRYLGYKHGRQVSSRTRRMVEEQLDMAREWLAPRAAYRVVAADPFASRENFTDAREVALTVCTAGETVEEKVSELFRRGDAAAALVVDAIGSVAAEAVADTVNEEIDRLARDQGWYTTRRFSPGYSNWPVEDQQLIFRHFPGEPAGVRLTSGYMMLPRKSVSFAVKMGPLPMAEINPGRCPACSRRDRCAYRDDRLCAG